MSGSDSSERGILERYSGYFRLLGSSLTGITAIFMAVGFLAERARLAMLGLPATTFDLQQYLEVGARLIALLPVLVGNAALLMFAGLFDASTDNPPTSAGIIKAGFWIALCVAAVVIVRLAFEWWYSSDAKNNRRFASRITDLVRENLLLVVLPGLVYLLFVQIDVVDEQLNALQVRDMLFDPIAVQADGPNSMKQLRMDGNAAAALTFFGRLLFLTIISGAGLYVTVTAVLRRRQDATAWRKMPVKILIGISGLLLVSQVTLLPVTYGTMLSQTQFSNVCIALRGSEDSPAAALPDTRLVLVHETSDGVYVYSRVDRTMWYVPRDTVGSIAYFDMVDVLSRPDAPKSCQVN